MHVWTCETPAQKPPGLHTTAQEPKQAHFTSPAVQKHHQNSTRRHPERHKKSEMVAGEGKKSANFLAPTISGRPPFRSPHPSGPKTLRRPPGDPPSSLKPPTPPGRGGEGLKGRRADFGSLVFGSGSFSESHGKNRIVTNLDEDMTAHSMGTLAEISLAKFRHNAFLSPCRQKVTSLSCWQPVGPQPGAGGQPLLRPISSQDQNQSRSRSKSSSLTVADALDPCDEPDPIGFHATLGRVG